MFFLQCFLKGFVPAMNALAWYYEQFEKDYQQAVQLWEKADFFGSPDAPLNLGVLHSQGLYPGKPPNQVCFKDILSLYSNTNYLEHSMGNCLCFFSVCGLQVLSEVCRKGTHARSSLPCWRLGHRNTRLCWETSIGCCFVSSLHFFKSHCTLPIKPSHPLIISI